MALPPCDVAQTVHRQIRRGIERPDGARYTLDLISKGEAQVTYPLEVGGVDDYPVKVGSMLLTLVEPHKGYERAYNRWYERDHFYAGCMVGPWLFAGSRWVATRALKDQRWPSDSIIAKPVDAGSYVAIYWVEKGHHADHFDGWATPQVVDLYANGRGFPERTHVHTVHVRPPRPRSIATKTRCRWTWLSTTSTTACSSCGGTRRRDGRGPARRAGRVLPPWSARRLGHRDRLVVVHHRAGRTPRDVPMDLGSSSGSTNRLVQLLFVGGDTEAAVAKVRAYTDAVESAGAAELLLAAPFFATVIGTDTYVDQL